MCIDAKALLWDFYYSKLFLKHASQGQHHGEKKKKDELTFFILVSKRACKQFKAIFFFDLQSLLKSVLFIICKSERTLSNQINICFRELESCTRRNYSVLGSVPAESLLCSTISEINQATAVSQSISSLLLEEATVPMKEETFNVCHSWCAHLLPFLHP